MIQLPYKTKRTKFAYTTTLTLRIKDTILSPTFAFVISASIGCFALKIFCTSCFGLQDKARWIHGITPVLWYSIVQQQLIISGEFVTHRIKYGLGHAASTFTIHPFSSLGPPQQPQAQVQSLTCSVASNAEKSLEKTSLSAGKIYSVWWVILPKGFEMFHHTCIWNRKNTVYAAQCQQSLSINQPSNWGWTLRCNCLQLKSINCR